MIPLHLFQALVKKLGKEAAFDYMKLPNTRLHGMTPIDAVKKGQTTRVEKLIREMVGESTTIY
jgi:hypothetical protein